MHSHAQGLQRLACAGALALLLASHAGTSIANDQPGGNPQADAAVLAERDRLARANAELQARLEAMEKKHALAAQLDKQATRLAGLAERLERRLESAQSGTLDDVVIADDDNGRLATLQRHLATAKRQLLDAEARADKLDARVTELEARLKQQQLMAQEALLRADKAEKLHAALEEAHARVRTENERLTLKLATAKERQAQAMQRVLDLDSQLEVKAARAMGGKQAVSVTPQDEAKSEPDGAASAPAGTTVVYEVRAEDTLSRIAAKVYGDANAWQRIFDANRDLLEGPDDLSLGMRLIIP
jgi:nucleoid-associated protein YgaU